MRYATSRFVREQKDIAYRIFITDVLRMSGEGIAKLSGGSYISQRFADILYPTKEDDRTGDEIAEDIITRAGLVVV